jgi:trans-AT polyketide synthase/acyltransferase/oxidoreductase domain-containing protein
MQEPETRNPPVGWWIPGEAAPESNPAAIRSAIARVGETVCLVGDRDGKMAAARGGTVVVGRQPSPTGEAGRLPLLAYAPALHPSDLGDPAIKSALGLKFPYIVGAMANGITSVRMVEAAGKAGMIGFFGAAGLAVDQIEAAAMQLRERLPGGPFGFNLIHSPNEPDLEAATVALYLNRGIRLVSASAYLDLTLPLVAYRLDGIHRAADGRIVCPNTVVAKISRIEVARKFFAPPPEKHLRALLAQGRITAEQAEMAAAVPMAEIMTAEADSGGHTDNQPAMALLPTILALRDQMTGRYGYPRPLLVGLGGGVATPDSTAAAFALGAAYVLTGSVNQACTEAGTSETVRLMLAEAGQADVTMAPAADMFEMGVKVQVLKRGTMFAFRAARLYELYNRFDSVEQIPAADRVALERDFFRRSFEEEWRQTQAFFHTRDPRQLQRAETDPKHKLALIFRSYLGQSSGWANSGEPTRKIDYQIWCGPAMGAFNEWAKGSFLEDPRHRSVATVAMNLLTGAAVATRFRWLRSQLPALPPTFGTFRPLPLPDIETLIGQAPRPVIHSSERL